MHVYAISKVIGINKKTQMCPSKENTKVIIDMTEEICQLNAKYLSLSHITSWAFA